ncbi:MAG: Calx-beta domain-containing protein [Acidobacteriota bacterium]
MRISSLAIATLLGLAATATLAVAKGGSSGPGVLHFDEVSSSASEASGFVIVLVERSGGESGAVSVQYRAVAGTAVAGTDFQPTSGTLNWANGDETTKSFSVTILNDSVVDGSKTVLLQLFSPTGGATLDAQRAQSTLTLGDDDNGGGGGVGGGGGGGVGLFKFEEGGALAFESSGVAVVVVERSGGEAGAVSVRYTTSDGSALAGSDYRASTGVLSWAAGVEGRQTINIPLIKDGVEEPSETFQVTLSDPTGGATVSSTRGSIAVTIEDGNTGAGNPSDDSNKPGELRFDELTFSAPETTAFATIRVERSHGEGPAVSVRYSTSDGTAQAGIDYTPASGVLRWAAGDRSIKTFKVPLKTNPATGSRVVNLRLSDPTGGAVIAASGATSRLVILDSNGDTSACLIDDSTLCLGGGRFRARVNWLTPQGGAGSGHRRELGDSSGAFWFFGDDNLEMLIKVVDACDGYGHFWVFYSATTNVGFTLTVTDTHSGLEREYDNPFGLKAESVNDTSTFATCP